MPSLLFLWPVLALQSQQLTATELSLGVASSFARQTFIGGEVGLARRTSNESRIALAVAAGSAEDQAATRGELTLQLLANPAALAGVAPYVGLGAAFSARSGSSSQGFVAVLIGLEGAPGRPHNWYAELGLSGGVRVAAGWRVRSFPKWWQARGGG